MCPTSFCPWPNLRGRRLAYAAFAPGVRRATWGTLHYLLRKDPEKYLAGILENLTTLDGEVAVRRLGADVGKVIEFLLCCQSVAVFWSTFGLRLISVVTSRNRH
jgi:hypothetical protein